VVELGRQRPEVVGEPLRGDPVVLPGAAREPDREVGPGRVERSAAAEGADRLGAEVQGAPRQPAAEVLQLLVAPALGLPDLVRLRLRVQRRIGPIENAFSKLKALLRTAAERTVEGLWAAIGRCLDRFTPRECANYFGAAGYKPT
jgi:hypothetical protein